MIGAYIGAQIPDQEGRSLAHPWTTISSPSYGPLVSSDTYTNSQTSEYESAFESSLPLATETPPTIILPAGTGFIVTTVRPRITNPPATAKPPAPEDDDVEAQISRLQWLADLLFAIMNILLVIFMMLGESTNLLGFLLHRHRQVFVTLRRKNRILRSIIEVLLANPILIALPPPTSDEDLNEPAQTASGSTQTEAAACSCVGMQTEAVNYISVGTQTEADTCSSFGMQTEAAICSPVGTQTEAAPCSTVGTQTGVIDSVSVLTQTDPVQHQSIGTQTIPDELPVDQDKVAELEATLAKQRQDSDLIIRNLQASLARMGTECAQLRAQQLRTSRLPFASPSPGMVPTYAGLAYDPHHNPNPEANAQQLARNAAMQQRMYQQQSQQWQTPPGRQGQGHRQ